MFLQHDDAPPHYLRDFRQHLNLSYMDRWIGSKGPISWPPRSPALNPFDYYLWGRLKELVYEVKINSREELIH